MFKIYSSDGYDVTAITEYEGTYETVGEALVALEKKDSYMDNFGYIYDCKRKETWYLVTFAYGEVDILHTLAYQKRETMIDACREVIEEIERRNA